MTEKFKILEELGLGEPALPVAEYRKMDRDEEWDYVQKKHLTRLSLQDRQREAAYNA